MEHIVGSSGKNSSLLFHEGRGDGRGKGRVKGGREMGSGRWCSGVLIQPYCSSSAGPLEPGSQVFQIRYEFQSCCPKICSLFRVGLKQRLISLYIDGNCQNQVRIWAWMDWNRKESWRVLSKYTFLSPTGRRGEGEIAFQHNPRAHYRGGSRAGVDVRAEGRQFNYHLLQWKF